MTKNTVYGQTPNNKSSTKDQFEEGVLIHLFLALEGRGWMLYGIFIVFLVFGNYYIVQAIASMTEIKSSDSPNGV